MINFNHNEEVTILGVDLAPLQSQDKTIITLQGIKEVKIQRRKHRSKRINKKWIKMYGYTTKQEPYHMKIYDCIMNNNGILTGYTSEGTKIKFRIGD